MIWWILVSVLGGVLVAVFFAQSIELPHREAVLPDDTTLDRVRHVEAYLAQSERAWRSTTRRLAAVIGAMVVSVGIFTSVFQAERDGDQAQARAFALSACRATAETREQQRDRDDRVVADFERELDRLDRLIANAVQPEDVPGVDAELLPVLVFLASDRDERLAVDRRELLQRLEDARTEAETYAQTFPIPPCDAEGGLTFEIDQAVPD